LTNLSCQHYGSEKDFGCFAGVEGFELPPPSTHMQHGFRRYGHRRPDSRSLLSKAHRNTFSAHSGAALRLPLDEEPEEAA
jgi:hypothetical protein